MVAGRVLLGAVLALSLACSTARMPGARQIVVSANDNRFDLEYGRMAVLPDPQPDTLTILDLGEWPPSVVEIDDIANSVLGPPSNVAITPDQSLALVANSLRIDDNDPTTQVPDRIVHIIDLDADPPAKIGEVTVGLQPSGMAIDATGTLALVANRAAGTISVLGIDGRDVTVLDTVTVGTATSEVSHVAISRDGRTGLATKRNENSVAVLAIDGQTVVYTGRDLSTGVKPYPFDIHPNGRVAVVANSGDGRGDADTAAVIDLTSQPPRVVRHFTVGVGPEDLIISPDGRLVAITLMNGSNLAADHPFRTENGLVRLFRLHGTELTFADEQLVGAIPEGVTFTNDGRYLLVQNYVARTISVFRIAFDRLHPTNHDIPVSGQPAAMRAASRGPAHGSR